MSSEKADYTEVDAAIAKAEKLNAEDYVDFSKVTEAINAIVRVAFLLMLLSHP